MVPAPQARVLASTVDTRLPDGLDARQEASAKQGR